MKKILFICLALILNACVATYPYSTYGVSVSGAYSPNRYYQQPYYSNRHYRQPYYSNRHYRQPYYNNYPGYRYNGQNNWGRQGHHNNRGWRHYR